MTTSSKKVVLYNNMHNRWIIPQDLLFGSCKDRPMEERKTKYTVRILRSGESFCADKDDFDRYLKGCKAFAAMVANQHIRIEKKKGYIFRKRNLPE